MVDRHYYNPNEAQRAELKAHAAGMGQRLQKLRESRVRVFETMRNVRELRQAKRIDFEPVKDAFRDLGWSDSDAAELAAIDSDMRARGVL